MTFRLYLTGLCLGTLIVCPSLGDQPAADATSSGQPVLLDVLKGELDYAFGKLVTPEGVKPYYLGYTVTEIEEVAIVATLGAISRDTQTRRRELDVDLRVGDYSLDNTHNIRGGRGRGGRGYYGGDRVALDDNPAALRQVIWLATDRAFKGAVKRYAQVLTNVKVKVEEEDKSDDFSREEPAVYSEPTVSLTADREAWGLRLRKLSAIAREYPLIYSSGLSLAGETDNKFSVTSEGTRLQTSSARWRLQVSARTKADDGMNLSQSFIFNAADQEGLPGDEEIARKFRGVIDQVLAMRSAPIVEPYTGPAILRNRASGVFFHEIFGHRIEGHRQKDVEEGQTFTKKIDQPVLPEFISVNDDPTLARFGQEDLRGHYKYDDEGVPAQNVRLVDNGILKTFLLGRSPVEGFSKSNGHGRRQPGRAAVSRQGNLIVSSQKQVPFDELRRLLIAECQKQDKPYGLLFEDITGGFTGTARRGPQTFKVLPVVVYRIYADGRPDELVRGADIVGTPLSCFEKIICTGDDPGVFNGSCGAESGWVPVAAVSPSILVSSIEIEKRERAQSRPPILAPPVAEALDGTTAGK